MTAILWDNGKWIDLGKLSRKSLSSGNFIDEEGRVLGTAGDSDGIMRGMLWRHGRAESLRALPYHSSNRLTVSGSGGVLFGDSKVGIEWGAALTWWPGAEKPQEIDQQLPVETDWFLVHVFDCNKLGQVLAFGNEGNVTDDLVVLTPTQEARVQEGRVSE